MKDFVFTVDNLPAIYLMRLLLAGRSNVLLAGSTGARLQTYCIVHSTYCTKSRECKPDTYVLLARLPGARHLASCTGTKRACLAHWCK